MRNRSVIEMMVIILTGLVGFVMVSSALLVIIIELRDPEADTDVIVQTLTNLTSGILGALLGLLAGKSSADSDFGRRPDGTRNGFVDKEK